MITSMRITTTVDGSDSGEIVFIDELGKETYRGSVDTDLKPGRYKLRVDRAQKKWVIFEPAVKTGLRFYVDLDGPNPWTLTYSNPVSLEVTADKAIGDLLAGTVDIGNVRPSEHPNYIQNVVQSVSIPLWGGPFSLNREKLGALILPRSECRLDDDPVAGELELLKVYQTRELALDALRKLGRPGYAYYIGLAGHIWPTILSDTTAPWLSRTLRKAIEVERADAKAAEALGWDLLLWYVGARFPAKASGPPSKPPSMESVPGSAKGVVSALGVKAMAKAGTQPLVFVELGAGDLKASVEIARKAQGTVKVIAVDARAPGALAVKELEALGGMFVKGTAESLEAGSADHVFQYFPWRIDGSGGFVTGGTWRLVTDTIKLLKPQGASPRIWRPPSFLPRKRVRTVFVPS